MSASKSRHDDIVQISIDAWVSCFAAASRKRIAAVAEVQQGMTCISVCSEHAQCDFALQICLPSKSGQALQNFAQE